MMMPSMHIKTGLEPSEIVIRGGFLQTPAVLGDTVTVFGKPFVYLWKSSNVLRNFLVRPTKSCRKTLCHTAVFDQLATLRNAEYQRLKRCLSSSLGTAAQSDDERPPTAADPPTDDLGIEAEERQSGKKAKRDRKPKITAKLLPRIVTVSYERPGMAPWQPSLLCEPGTKSAAMEATTENFQVLFDIVHKTGASANASGTADRSSSDAAVQGKQARLLADGSREYFIRGRWIRKLRSPAAAGTAKGPVSDKRKFTTLVRRPSEEASGPKVRKSRRPRPKQTALGQMAAAVAPGTAAPAVDGFVDDLDL